MNNKTITALLFLTMVANCVSLCILWDNNEKIFKSGQCNSLSEVSEDKRPVICSGCDSCFSTLDSLYRHYDEYYCPRSSAIRHFFKMRYHKEAYPDQIKCYRVAFHRLVEIDVKAYDEKSAIKQARSFVDLESYKQCEDVYIGTNDIDSIDYGKYTIDGHPYSDSRIRNIVTQP